MDGLNYLCHMINSIIYIPPYLHITRKGVHQILMSCIHREWFIQFKIQWTMEVNVSGEIYTIVQARLRGNYDNEQLESEATAKCSTVPFSDNTFQGSPNIQLAEMVMQ